MEDHSSFIKNDLKDKIEDNDICVSVIHQLIHLPGFQLLEEDEFIQLVHERSILEYGQDQISNYQKYALNIYSEKIYQATASSDNPFLQEKGFQELANYLYRMAYNFYLHQSLPSDEKVDKAQDTTQIAVLQIYSHLNSVKAPGGFLKWCSVILRHICLEEARSRNSYISIDHINDDIDLPVFSDYSRPDKECIYECLSAAISRLNLNYQRVIKLSYFSIREDGSKIGDEEIAAELNINNGNLYTRRSRAISLLKKDEQLYRCIQGIV